LEGTENRISTARQDYNSAVQAYNSYIRRFPQVLTAKMVGSKAREYFEVTDEAARDAPKVEF
jgi:LemA protein